MQERRVNTPVKQGALFPDADLSVLINEPDSQAASYNSAVRDIGTKVRVRVPAVGKVMQVGNIERKIAICKGQALGQLAQGHPGKRLGAAVLLHQPDTVSGGITVRQANVEVAAPVQGKAGAERGRFLQQDSWDYKIPTWACVPTGLEIGKQGEAGKVTDPAFGCDGLDRGRRALLAGYG
jgi:hypothetical protein